MCMPHRSLLHRHLLLSVDAKNTLTSTYRKASKHAHRTATAPIQSQRAQSTPKGSAFTNESQTSEPGATRQILKRPHLPSNSEQEQRLSTSISDQEEDILSEASGETPVGEDPLESDAGDPHPSSPSDDFTSYVQMISLKMHTEQPPPPTEDDFWRHQSRKVSPFEFGFYTCPHGTHQRILDSTS